MSWLDLMHKHALTLGDIRKLKPGDSIDVVTFHRNFGDEMMDVSEGVVLDPLELFKQLEKIDTYTHKHGVTGKLKMGYEDDEDTDDNFSFDILYKDKKMWYPLSIKVGTHDRIDPDR